MDDLISRQAAIERATKDHDFFRGATIPTDKARRDELLNVMCWLRELPSVQPQIEIIRCKDCKHWGKRGLCEMWDHYISNEDFYCGCAKRRTDE